MNALNRIRMLILALALVAMLLSTAALATPAPAAVGDSLDTAFGRGFGVQGYLLGGAGLPAGLVVADALGLADGSTLVAGAIGGDFGLLKLAPDGAPDPAFNNGAPLRIDLGGSSEHPVALALQPDDKILIAGYVDSPSGNRDIGVARVTPAGRPDPGFDGDGARRLALPGVDGTDAAHQILVTDERIILAAVSSSPRCDGSPCGSGLMAALVALDYAGRLDESFGEAGVFLNPFGGNMRHARVVRQADGRLILASSYSTGAEHYLMMLRVSADGVQDVDFGPRGVVAVGGVAPDAGLTVMPNNLLVVVARHSLRWFTPEGRAYESPASREGIMGLPTHSEYVRVLAYPDGELLVAGSKRDERTLSLAAANNLGRSDAFGRVPRSDLTDALNGRALDTNRGDLEGLRSLRATPDGRVLVSGRSNGQSYVARLYPDGSLDTGGRVRHDQSKPGAAFTDIVVLPDGRIVAVSELLVTELAAFHPDGRSDPAFAAVSLSNAYQPRLALSADGHILLAYSSIAADQQITAHIRRYDLAGRPAPFAVGPVLDISLANTDTIGVRLLVQGDGKLVLAGKTSVADERSHAFVARFLADGRPDTGFGRGGVAEIDLDAYNEVVHSAGFDGQGRLHLLGAAVVSPYPNYNSDFLALRLRDDGALDPAFAEEGVFQHDFAGYSSRQHISAMTVDSRGRLIFVGLLGDHASSNARVARFELDENGALDESVGISGLSEAGGGYNSTPAALLTTAQGVIVVGCAVRSTYFAGGPAPIMLAIGHDGSGSEDLGETSVVFVRQSSPDRCPQAAARDLAGGGLIIAGGAGDRPSLARWTHTPAPAGHLMPQPESYQATAGVTLAVEAGAGLLANDTGGAAPLAAMLVTPPASGSLELSPNGALRYTPRPGFVGADSFTYRLSDGIAAAAPVTVAISVERAAPPTSPAPDDNQLYLPLLRR